MNSQRITEQVAAALGSPEARRVVAEQFRHKRLAKDEMEDVLLIIKGIVARYQGVAYKAAPGDVGYSKAAWLDLREWLELFVATGMKLAEFQSPKFKAIGFFPPAPAVEPMRVIEAIPGQADNVVQINDPVRALGAYKRMLERAS